MHAKLIGAFVIVFLNLYCCCGCSPAGKSDEVSDTTLEFEKKLDSIASIRIDSAYKAVQQQCDSANKYRLPLLIDSLQHLKKDSAQ
ncbi:hypothetical protein [Deminuibacter soli]|nr:hypothetical protein [Deminuibacter soli]